MHGSTPYALLFIVFFGLFISWIIYQMLIRLAPVYEQRIVRYAYWAVSVSVIVIYFFTRKWGGMPAGLSYLVSFVSIWTIGQLFLCILLVIVLCMRWITSWMRSGRRMLEVPDPSRRRFLGQATALLPALTLGLTARTVYATNHELTIPRLNLAFADLPAHLHGLKLMQISDSHIGAYFGIERLEQVIGIIRAEQPDIVVITGDLIDDLSLLEATVDRLSQLHAFIPYGIYFCWGNHEYFRDQPRIRKALMDSPITVLENDSRMVVPGDRPLYLLGVDYPLTRKLQEQGIKREQMMEQTLRTVPAEAFAVLIAHHPDFIDDAYAANIPLTLAGHSHGGQIAILGHSILPVQYKYMSGLYQHKDLYGYVSNGAGHWFPLRYGRPAEIAVVTLLGKTQV